MYVRHTGMGGGTITLAAALLAAIPLAARAQDTTVLETMNVTATPLRSAAADDRLPFPVQSFGQTAVKDQQSLSVADFLNRSGSSFTLNDIQNNPLQPDLQYRGFTASPLLGTPQGMSVYQNGVRMNGNFGQAVNWDLMPDSFINRMTVIGGSNPLFGLNTLGGAVLIDTKTGFNSEGGEGALTYGSFNRLEVSAGQGSNDGTFGFYLGARHFQEDGWRDHSNSNATNLYAAAGWRGDKTTLDLYVNAGDTDLRGNGPAPVGLLAIDRAAVFTYPDRTQNRMGMVSLAAHHQVSDAFGLDARLFLRNLRSKSFNGDGAQGEQCDAPYGAYLCAGDGGTPGFARDQNGGLVSSIYDAINNRSIRNELMWGGTIEAQYDLAAGDMHHDLVAGLDFLHGRTNFTSSVEFATLAADRGTSGSGLYDAAGYTGLRSVTDNVSLYAGDTVQVTPALSATLSARYVHLTTDSLDSFGNRPYLTGRHTYNRLNYGAGLSWRITPLLTLYGGYHQSSRTPTPVELACAEPDQPCTLPNSFIADPPLDDVVSHGIEAGIRGADGPFDYWRIGVFRTVNTNDIIFQTTGGATANQGFFSNVGDTRRQGIEISLRGAMSVVRWTVNYTYLDATFRSAFLVSSPNHPDAVNGVIPVQPGDRLPGLPAHQLNASLFADVTDALNLGVDMTARSGQYLRGDEGNLYKKTASYAIFNASARYHLADWVMLTARIENIFDKAYETFGTFGQPQEVLGAAAGDSPVFLGPGQPRGVWLGLNTTW